MTRTIARRVVWAAVAGTAAAGLTSYAAFAGPPIPVTIALAALCALSAWRPFDALLVFVGLAGVAGTLQALAGADFNSPFTLAQAALLALVAGLASRAARRGAPISLEPPDLALLGFALICVASALSLLPTMLLQVGVESVADARRVLPPGQFFQWASGGRVIEHTLLALEGVALALVARRVVRHQPGRAESLILMLLAGAVAAAALNVIRLLEIVVRQEHPVASIVPALVNVRFNTQYGDLNAAGSFFAMTAVLCAGFCGVRSTRQRLLLAAVPLFACALWVTGSRVAMVATLLCAPAVVIWQRIANGRWHHLARRVAGLGLIVVLAAAAAVLMFKTARHGSLSFSASTRVQLLGVGVAMTREHPLTGIGISRFYTRFPEFAPPELFAAFKDATGRDIRHENAHNQFVQYLAELGVPGLAMFVLALWLCLLAGSPSPPWRVATVSAIAAFLLTSLAGHPLLTRQVAYSFWLLLGAAAAGAAPLAPSRGIWLRRAMIVLGLILAVTMPSRWRAERASASLEHATLGMSPAAHDESGERFQWAGRRATVFVDGSAGMIWLPLRSPDEQPRKVRILLDGRPADIVTLTGSGWRRVPIVLPAEDGAPAFRRIDLEVEAAGEASVGRLLMVGRVVKP